MSAKVSAVIGGCLLLAGVGAGLMPVSSSGTSCGSALNGEGNLTLVLTAGQAAADNCASMLSVIQVPVWVLIGLGAIVLVISGYQATKDF